MIDQGKLAAIKDQINGIYTETPLDDLTTLLEQMSQSELRRLSAAIGKLLPTDKLSELNLESELVEQYNKIKGIMDEVLGDTGVQTNQKGQIANAVVSALKQLAQMQEDLQRQETLKIMEACLIEVVTTFAPEEQAKFYAEYERIATKAGLM